jgi:VanZ family protein
MSTRKNIWLRRGTFFVLVAYWLALITGTHVPQPPKMMGLEAHDKLLHTSAYAGLAFLLMLNVWWRARPSARHFAAILVVVAICGGLDELTQPPFGRTADWFDWFADLGGTAIGLAVAAGVCRFLERFRTDRVEEETAQ